MKPIRARVDMYDKAVRLPHKADLRIEPSKVKCIQ